MKSFCVKPKRELNFAHISHLPGFTLIFPFRLYRLLVEKAEFIIYLTFLDSSYRRKPFFDVGRFPKAKNKNLNVMARQREWPMNERITEIKISIKNKW